MILVRIRPGSIWLGEYILLAFLPQEELTSAVRLFPLALSIIFQASDPECGAQSTTNPWRERKYKSRFLLGTYLKHLPFGADFELWVQRKKKKSKEDKDRKC